jgi:hypothetical protein
MKQTVEAIFWNNNQLKMVHETYKLLDFLLDSVKILISAAYQVLSPIAANRLFTNLQEVTIQWPT